MGQYEHLLAHLPDMLGCDNSDLAIDYYDDSPKNLKELSEAHGLSVEPMCYVAHEEYINSYSQHSKLMGADKVNERNKAQAMQGLFRQNLEALNPMQGKLEIVNHLASEQVSDSFRACLFDNKEVKLLKTYAELSRKYENKKTPAVLKSLCHKGMKACAKKFPSESVTELKNNLSYALEKGEKYSKDGLALEGPDNTDSLSR